jgi:hypothetical protein
MIWLLFDIAYLNPQLLQLSPLLKAQRYEKSLDDIERFKLWAEADLFRTAFPMIFE